MLKVTAATDSFPRLLPWPLKRSILGRRGSEFSPKVVAVSITPLTIVTLWLLLVLVRGHNGKTERKIG
jgi:hypothetical protein